MRRYIDAELLKADIRPFAEYESNRNNKDWIRRFEIAIDDQPTADVRENVQLDVCPLYGGACGYPSGECYDCPRHGNFRENVRGEWISKMYECSRENYDQVFCCSVCGVSNDWRRTNFCPHCGAEMRAKP